MIAFLLRRVVQAAIVLLAMSLVIFAGIFVIGNPIDVLMNPAASHALIQRTVEKFGLDQPLWRQYLDFLGNLLQGDLGRSYVFDEPAIRLILSRLPATLELALTASVIALGLGIPLGMWAGWRPDSVSARLIMGGSILGFSLPSFWVGLMLILVFSVELGWLPSGGRGATAVIFGVRLSILTGDGLAHLLLPALNLALFKLSLITRLTRAGMREVLPMDFVRFARAKGLSERRVLFVHVLKNIMLPIVTVLGLELGSVIAFAVVTETIFDWPGMGKLIIDSIGLLDRPVIVAYLLVIVTMFLVINLVVDVIYSLLDPRVRLAEDGA